MTIVIKQLPFDEIAQHVENSFNNFNRTCTLDWKENCQKDFKLGKVNLLVTILNNKINSETLQPKNFNIECELDGVIIGHLESGFTPARLRGYAFDYGDDASDFGALLLQVVKYYEGETVAFNKRRAECEAKFQMAFSWE